MIDATAPQQKQYGAEDVMWDLSIYYSGLDDPQIEADIAKSNELTAQYAAAYRGRVANLTASELAQALQEREAITEIALRLNSFGMLNFSVYSEKPEWGAFLQRLNEHSAQLETQTVFLTLEWNAVDDAQATALLDDPALADYRHFLEAVRRYRPYMLSEAEEKLLIEKDVTGASAWERLFEQLLAMVQVTIDDESMPMPIALSITSSDPDREKRRVAADAITKALEARKLELTFIINTIIADKATDDRLRGYPDWITARNLSNKASDEMVQTLIESVTNNYELVARHYRVKRALLGYDELYDYDRYAPLNLTDEENEYVWDEARAVVETAYHNFSETAGQAIARFFDEDWIHAPVKAGKHGGAFAWYGSKGTHPWVFVNYLGRPKDVMTLAHELGHGLHMYLAGQAQNSYYIMTPLTTAEMASVFGEMIVFQKLMKEEEDPIKKLALLAEKVEDSFATVFRQISLNRFEDSLHRARRAEGELSTERINQLWMQSQHAMFGDSVVMRDEYAQWWSYIPHFIGSPGYVYAYAFGELLVFSLYQLYQETGDEFVPKYLELLAAGDSDYPEALLARAGIDLTDPEFWNNGIALLRALVDQEEKLARQLFPERF